MNARIPAGHSRQVPGYHSPPTSGHILGTKAYTNNDSTQESRQLQVWLRFSGTARPGDHSLDWHDFHPKRSSSISASPISVFSTYHPWSASWRIALPTVRRTASRSASRRLQSPQRMLLDSLAEFKHDTLGFVVYRCTYQNDAAWNHFK